jgi:hypothetical protein
MHDAPFPARTPVTHLSKKALKMRHKIAAHHLNPLKTNSLKPHDLQFHTRHPDASHDVGQDAILRGGWQPPLPLSCANLPRPRISPTSPPPRRNLTMLNVLQQNIGGFCPLPVCAPED